MRASNAINILDLHINYSTLASLWIFSECNISLRNRDNGRSNIEKGVFGEKTSLGTYTREL